MQSWLQKLLELGLDMENIGMILKDDKRMHN